VWSPLTSRLPEDPRALAEILDTSGVDSRSSERTNGAGGFPLVGAGLREFLSTLRQTNIMRENQGAKGLSLPALLFSDVEGHYPAEFSIAHASSYGGADKGQEGPSQGTRPDGHLS